MLLRSPKAHDRPYILQKGLKDKNKRIIIGKTTDLLFGYLLSVSEKR